MTTYEAHPLADEYPLASPQDASFMEADMREAGFDHRFPVIIYQGKILDGRTRYAVAQRTGADPRFMLFNGTQEEAEAFVRRANENRRHLDAAWLEQRRQARRTARVGRVAQKRHQGESLPAIAKDEGVSVAQVRRDLGKAAELCPPGKVEPKDGKVTGKDGKTRPAKKGAGRRKGKETEAAPPTVKDALGTNLPPGLADLFADDAYPDALQKAEAAALAIDALAPVIDRLRARHARLPYLDFEQLGAAHRQAAVQAGVVLEAFRDGQPHAACPACKGAGCADCRTVGYVPEWRLEEMKEGAA